MSAYKCSTEYSSNCLIIFFLIIFIFIIISTLPCVHCVIVVVRVSFTIIIWQSDTAMQCQLRYWDKERTNTTNTNHYSSNYLPIPRNVFSVISYSVVLSYTVVNSYSVFIPYSVIFRIQYYLLRVHSIYLIFSSELLFSIYLLFGNFSYSVLSLTSTQYLPHIQ